MNGASAELQEISLAALLNDPYVLAKCMSMVSERFYIDPSYKLIYKSLTKYYDEYNTIPSRKELSVMIEELHKEDYGDINDVMKSLNKIYETKEEIKSEDFAYEQVVKFIRRNMIEDVLNKTVRYMEKGKVDLDEIGDQLMSSMYISLKKAPTYRLSDTSKIKEVKEEALGGTDSPVKIKFFIDVVNQYMQYGAIPPGTLNMVVAPPGRGKTTTLINQGVSAAKQGFNTLHMFLGDMTRYDGQLRYLSCLTGVPTKTLVGLNNDEMNAFIKKHNMTGVLSNIIIASYAADELSSNQVMEEINAMQKDYNIHFDQIIIDYDENISEESDNMYKSGGQIYNKMALFARSNRSVIWIAAQPNKEYWKMEVIPLEAASESSKKQKIIDMMLTIGKPGKSSTVGTINVAKNRRGTDGGLLRIRIDGFNARVVHISNEDYQEIKAKESQN